MKTSEKLEQAFHEFRPHINGHNTAMDLFFEALMEVKEYETKAENLPISDVVGRSEQLPCEHDYQPDTTCGVDITCCTKCGDII